MHRSDATKNLVVTRSVEEYRKKVKWESLPQEASIYMEKEVPFDIQKEAPVEALTGMLNTAKMGTQPLRSQEEIN